ncbi:MAG: helix-turn-helix domain-containing protein [Bacteroidota bacterium]
MKSKTKTRQEVANEFGVNRKTLYRWLKKAGIQLSGNSMISPRELKLIYKELGTPQ